MLRLRSDRVEWRLVEDEVVALDLDDAIYFALNKTGAVLWQRLAEGATRDTLVATIVDRFKIDESQASADVDAFLQSLRERELLAEETG